MKYKKYNKKSWILLIALCGVIGIIIASGRILGQEPLPESNIAKILIVIWGFSLGIYIQVILHEAGHLVCGLLSGYEFISFRIGSLTFVKENDGLSIKKFHIQGTGGQCIMMPKGENYKECHFILYNLGGILINALVSICILVIVTVYKEETILKLILYTVGVAGLLIVVTNGIPTTMGGVPNDGHNTLGVCKSDRVKYCFYRQLKTVGLLYKGTRIKDLPLQWFQLPEDADFNNPLISSIKCLEAQYYHDKLEFDKAKQCYEELLKLSPNLIKLYQMEIHCELLFYEIIGERNLEVIERLYTKELKKYIKATKDYITRKRLMYAYYLIIENNMEKADKARKEFYVLTKTYPAKAEVESEIEVMEFIEAIR